jgi:hypothetical protein
MPEGIDAASFEFYEGIRILVPGGVAVGLTVAVGDTFGIKSLDVTHNSLVAVLLAFLVGLVFYFVDAPARAAVFAPTQPTDKIGTWDIDKQYQRQILNRYLLLLDHGMPPSVRARALYMGSMYRIGFESVYLLLLSALGVFLTPSFTEQGASRSFAGANLSTIVAASWLGGFGFAIYRYLKGIEAASRRVRREPNRSTVRWSAPDYTIEAAAWAAFVVIVDKRTEFQSWILALPAIVVGALWAFRYFKGYSGTDRPFVVEAVYIIKTPYRLISAAQHNLASSVSPPPSRRKPVDVIQAIQLAGSAATLAVSAHGFSPPSAINQLPSGSRAGWAIALLVGLLLVTARGHERRLRGAYATQNTWLDMNKEQVIKEYFPPAVDDGQVPTTTREQSPDGSEIPSRSRLAKAFVSVRSRAHRWWAKRDD